MIYAITLTNKPNLLPEAIETVRCQTVPVVHVIGYDNGAWEWRDRYPPAVWFNEIAYRLRPEDYLFWLSDDDLLECHFAAVMSAALDSGREAVYCFAYHVVESEGRRQLHRMLPSGMPVFDDRRTPRGEIDGGQVMIKRSMLDRVPYPYAPESIGGARVSDGAMLDQIARAAPIYPVGQQPLVTLRTTPFSSHTRPSTTRGGGVVMRDWLEGVM